jgi:hypothetical protein
METMKKLILSIIGIFYLLNSSFFICFSQEFTVDESHVFMSKEITFYGYDFTNLKLVEPERLNEPNLERHIPFWIDFLNERRTEKTYASHFKKDKFTFDFNFTQKKASEINGEDLVVLKKQNIDKSAIQGILNNYSLNEKEGIGFVVLIECFEKQNKTASAYFVFFDIKTKKILMSDYYFRNEADGYGLGNYWGQAVHAIIGHYIDEIYRPNLKNYLKGKPKVKLTKWSMQE